MAKSNKKNFKNRVEEIDPFEDFETQNVPEEVILDISPGRNATAIIKPNKPAHAINIGSMYVAGMKHVWGPYCSLIPNISLKMLTSAERKKRRHFSTAEREALYIAADGKCMICGCILEGDNWQPDHIVPFSKGGLTDVINGQALCTPCNLIKGDR